MWTFGTLERRPRRHARGDRPAVGRRDLHRDASPARRARASPAPRSSARTRRRRRPGRGEIYRMTGARRRHRELAAPVPGRVQPRLAARARAVRRRGQQPGRAARLGHVDAARRGRVEHGVPAVAACRSSPGRWYWFALLNPPTRPAHAAPGATAPAPPALGQSRDLTAFPATWVAAPLSWHVDGHVSGGAWPDAAPVVEPTPTPTPTPPPRARRPRVTPTPTPTATAGPCRSDSCDFEFEPVPRPRHDRRRRRRTWWTATPPSRHRSSWARGATTLNLGPTRSLRAPVVTRPAHADGARARHARRHDRAARLRLQAHDARRPRWARAPRGSRSRATAGRMSP